MRYKGKKQKLSGIILILVGILGILYLLFGLSLGWGVYFGCTVIALAGVAFIIYGIMKLIGWRPPENKFYKVFAVLFKTGLIMFISSFVIIEGFIVGSALNSKCPKADYLLVEGAALLGERPSLELSYRLQTAYRYLNQYPDAKVVASGGKGPKEAISEAEAMERYFIAHGISADRIIKEDKSTSTFENQKFSKKIIDGLQAGKPYTVAIVTNDFHIFRSKMLAGRLGLKAYGCPAETPLYIIPNHYVREYFAVIKSFLVDR